MVSALGSRAGWTLARKERTNDGGGLHLEKLKNNHISAADQAFSTKIWHSDAVPPQFLTVLTAEKLKF